MTRISSPETPCHVSPPLSASKNGTHGGEFGSSVCRGGSPTQFFVIGCSASLSPMSSSGGLIPVSTVFDDPSESEESDPSDCGGGSSSSGGTGAYSRTVDGFACGRFSAEGMITSITTSTTAKVTS